MVGAPDLSYERLTLHLDGDQEFEPPVLQRRVEQTSPANLRDARSLRHLSDFFVQWKIFQCVNYPTHIEAVSDFKEPL